MGDNMGDNVGDHVGDHVGDNMGDHMGDTMGDNMGDHMGDHMGDNMGGTHSLSGRSKRSSSAGLSSGSPLPLLSCRAKCSLWTGWSLNKNNWMSVITFNAPVSIVLPAAMEP